MGYGGGWATDVGLLDPCAQQTIKLASKIDRNASVHATLAVKKALCAAQREYPFVPNIGMYAAALIPLYDRHIYFG